MNGASLIASIDLAWPDLRIGVEATSAQLAHRTSARTKGSEAT